MRCPWKPAAPGRGGDHGRCHRDSGRWAVLRNGALGTCTVEVVILEIVVGIESSSAWASRTSRAACADFLHHGAEHSGQEVMAPLAFTVFASTKRTSPPTGVQARPVATPISPFVTPSEKKLRVASILDTPSA